MDYTIEKKPKSQAVINLKTTAEETQKYFDAALKRLSKQVKLPGFRAGKVPEDVVRAKVGDAAIYNEALEHALPHLYAEVVQKEKLQPVSRPKVEVLQDNPLSVSFTVDLYPEVTVGDFSKTIVRCEPKKITEKDVDASIEKLKQSFADFEAVDRAAKMTDRVEIDFEGFDENKKPIAGAKSANHPVVLGSRVFVQGFEEALVGVKKGDTKEFVVTFPKDYHAEELKNKKVHFTVHVHVVEEQKTPTLNDDFAKRITGHKVTTADALKKEIRESLEKHTHDEAMAACEEKVLDAMIKHTTSDIPDSMIAEEIGYLEHDFTERLREQGIPLERFLEGQKQTMEQFRENLKPAALRRVTVRLALNVVAEREKIEVTEKEITDAVQAMKVTHTERERAAKLARVQLRMQKTLRHVYEKAIHTQSNRQ